MSVYKCTGITMHILDLPTSVPLDSTHTELKWVRVHMLLCTRARHMHADDDVTLPFPVVAPTDMLGVSVW